MSDVVSPSPTSPATSRPSGSLRRGLAVINPTISTRIILPLLLIVIVAAAIGMYAVTQLFARSLQAQFNDQLARGAATASSSLMELEQQLLAALRRMAFTEGVPQAVAARDSDSLDKWLRPAAANANLDRLIVFDRDGGVLLSLARAGSAGTQYETLPPPDVSAWAGVRQVLSASADAPDRKFIDVLAAPTAYLLYISAPVMDGDQLIGGISVGTTFDRLARRAGEQALAAVTLYATNGIVLGSTVAVPPASLSLNAASVTRLTAAARTGRPVEEISLNDEPYQVTYVPLTIHGRSIGLLAVALSSRSLTEHTTTVQGAFGVLFIGLSFAVAVTGLMIGGTITRSVAQLTAAAQRVQGGDTSWHGGLRSRDEFGELNAALAVMTDQLIGRSEEIRRLYQAQQQETARCEVVLSSMGDAVLVQHSTGDIILQNPAAEQLLEQVRRTDRTRQEFDNVCKQAAEWIEPRIVHLAGKSFSLRAAPVTVPPGEISGYVLVFRDVTRLMEVERLNTEVTLQLWPELRSPLMAVQDDLERLKTIEYRRLSAHGQASVDNLSDKLLTLARMIGQLTDVSAIISNNFTLEVGRLNLGAILQERMQYWRVSFNQRDLVLSFAPPPAIYVEADAERIGQVIDYLVHNAYRYTLPGGMVKVEARTSGLLAIISILDSGLGIGADEINKVFECMYRGHSADTLADAPGLGLGLYLAKYIIEAHGGRIELESQIEVGTLVTVYLPLAGKSE